MGAIVFVPVAIALASGGSMLVYLVRRSAALRASMAADLSSNGERVVMAPESANYEGATDGHSNVRGNGVLALTDRRLVFKKLMGAPIELRRDEIESARIEKTFGSRRVGGRQFLVVRLKTGGELGFLVRDEARWTTALTAP